MSMKWMRGYGGTRFVWNLVMSTLSTPSERSDAVSDADRVDAAHVAERAVVQHRRTTQTRNKSYSAKKARLRFFVFFNKRKPLRWRASTHIRKAKTRIRVYVTCHWRFFEAQQTDRDELASQMPKSRSLKDPSQRE